MALVVISPNMTLPVPVVGIDTGPDWANNLNSCLSIVDQHNHTTGQGVTIPPAGLNINSSLTFQNNSATNLLSLVFTAQTSVATLNALYVKGVDLYYNDGAGNPAIQMTVGGAVNATSSGISSGTATASFVSSVLVVNAATATPANIQAGSILIGNNVANSKFLTLAPPGAMGANFGLVLPSIPASQKIMTLDASGNMSAPYTVDGTTVAISANVIGVPAGGIGTTQLANSSVTTAKIADGAVTAAKLAAVNVQSNGNSGSYATTSGSFADVTNLSLSLTTTGRPVVVGLCATSGASTEVFALNGTGSSTGGVIQFLRDGVVVQQCTVQIAASGATSSSIIVPVGSMTAFDVAPSAGAHTYKAQARISVAGSTFTVLNATLFAYEL